MQGLESLPEETNFFVLEMANKKGFLLKSHHFFLFNTNLSSFFLFWLLLIEKEKKKSEVALKIETEECVPTRLIYKACPYCPELNTTHIFAKKKNLPQHQWEGSWKRES